MHCQALSSIYQLTLVWQRSGVPVLKTVALQGITCKHMSGASHSWFWVANIQLRSRSLIQMLHQSLLFTLCEALLNKPL